VGEDSRSDGKGGKSLLKPSQTSDVICVMPCLHLFISVTADLF